MKLDTLKENLDTVWDSVAEGWRHLRASAASALTRFIPDGGTNLPSAAEIDDEVYRPGRGWAMLGGDLFEDGDRLVARVELPGMAKEDIDIDVREDSLLIRGEKRFERESTQGRWHMMQCAYGSFQRLMPLPVAVRPDAARATYRHGVLRVELPKATPGKSRGTVIKVQ